MVSYMKNLFALCLLLSTTLVYAAQEVEYDYSVVDVKDGDTIVIEAPFLPAPLKPVLALRVYGVDTPEKAPRAKCEAEALKGVQATQFTKDKIANAQTTKVVLRGWDKFGGRVLGDIIIDGRSLRDMLIEQNLARPYFGEAKQSWCK